MARTEGPRGIGGWLAVFLLLYALAPFVGLAAWYLLFETDYLASDLPVGIGPYLEAIRLIMLVKWGVNAAIDSVIVWRFLMFRNWQTIRIGIALIWATPVISYLVMPLLLSIVSTRSLAAALVPYDARDIIGSLVWLALWTAYLLRSQRVANTYGRFEREDATALNRIFE